MIKFYINLFAFEDLSIKNFQHFVKMLKLLYFPGFLKDLSDFLSVEQDLVPFIVVE